MYRVTIASGRGAGRVIHKEYTFDFSQEGPDAGQMAELSDNLYNLGIDFDVDEDGDMVIDDILMAVSEGEPINEKLGDGKKYYRIIGEMV